MSEAYGLIGYPLKHSFSPVYFAKKFAAAAMDATYTAFAIEEIDALPALLKAHPQLKGFNVTIPYKTAVIPYLHSRHEDVVKIGACNCVKITEEGLSGYNTDWRAFRDSLRPLLREASIQALVLGTGGAAKAVIYALQQMGIRFSVASRGAGQGAIPYSRLDAAVLAQHRLIINTTPLGMYPDEGVAPEIPYLMLTPKHLLYDLIYNPAETLFLQRGKAAGARIKNGQEMLERQAELSWAIWNNY